MVKLEVVEDEAFQEKPESSKNGALFQEDDEDFTDTGTPPSLIPVARHPSHTPQTPKSQNPPT
jgi:hypothetical protein